MNTDREQVAVQRLLQRKFEELKAKNRRASLRTFAQRLGISAGAANEILKGQRRVSAKMASRLAERLLLDPSESAFLLSQFPDPVRRKRDETARTYRRQQALRLTADQFHTIAEWTHFAILSLVRTRDFNADPEWIGERLGVRAEVAKASLMRLVRMGLLEVDPNDPSKLRRTQARVETSDDVLNLAMQRSHLEDLERVANSIQNLPVTLRDVSSFTLPVDLKLLPKAKIILRQAQDQIDELMNTSTGTEVYRILTCMFPLTQVREPKISNQEKKK